MRHYLFLTCGFLLTLPNLSSAQNEAQIIENALRKAVAEVKPGVVGIVVSRSEAYRRYEAAPDPDTPWKLGRFDPDSVIAALPADRAAERRAILRLDLQRDDYIPESFGSGIVIDKNLVLTNAHVVRNATKVYVHVPGKKGSYADIHALDTRIDLAVLRLLDPPDGLRAVRLGDGSDDKVQGKFVALLAYAPTPGFRNDERTLAWGTVAATRRAARLPAAASEKTRGPIHQYGTLLQTDARVQAEWSGAALYNLAGEVIGLTTTIGAVGGEDNVGCFAVPFDAGFRRLIDILRRGEEIEYGFMGIRFMPDRGAVIADGIVPNSPAHLAGMRWGDQIIRIGNVEINSQDDLFLQTAMNPAGSTVDVVVKHGGDIRTLRMQLGKLDSPGPFIASIRPQARFGLRVDPPSVYCQRQASDVAVPKVGVMIREVLPGSPAEKAKLLTGRLITQVNDKDVSTPDQFYKAVDAAGDRVRLTLLSDDNAGESVELTQPARP